MKKNNKGYSLVEIIIVMAIIGVVGSAGTISFRMIYNARVTTVARKVHSYCKTVRLNNMTKAQMKYIHIFKDSSDGTYYINIDEQQNIDTSVKKEEIGNATLGVRYVVDSSSLSADEITIFFGRNGQCEVIDNAGNPISNVKQLKFTNGSRTAELNISTVTGKITM